MAEASKVYVGQKKGFLSEIERQQFLSYCAAPNTKWRQTGPVDPWHDRTIQHNDARIDIQALLRTVRQRTLNLLINAYKLEKPLYADSLSITRWRFGDDQKPHADNAHFDGSPHPYPWRDFGAIIYLNTDFEGGEIHFPDLKLKPKMLPGSIVFFPGALDFVHGVTRVMGGTRYTIALFLTHDQNHGDWL